MSDNVDQAVQILTERINTLLDKYAPVKNIQVRKKYAPWLSDATKKLMEQRNIAQQVAFLSKDQNRLREYKNLRNRVNNLLKSDKKNWEKAHLDHVSNSDSDLWKNLKDLVQWKNGGPPSQLFHNGELHSSPKRLAKMMNEFFINKVKNLLSNLQPTDSDPLRYLKRYMSGRNAKFQLRQVHPDEVLAVIRSLKNSKSTGLDTINVQILKLIAESILPSLTHIVNLSLASSTFPSAWKKAKVIPLLKKSDPLVPQNYRPVALLPVFSKILEKIVFKQISEYIESNNILHRSHHGSRALHSTSTALIEMYTHWIDVLENGDAAGIMMLDLSAAFDLVDHSLLLQKLEVMGFTEESIAWLKSYLTDRSQCIHLDGQFSELLPIITGVPQCSVLGALLYILFVNELPEVVHHHEDNQLIDCKDTCGSMCCYVDDSTCTVTGHNALELSEKLTFQYQCIANFFRENRLVINDNKTQLLILGTKKHAQLQEEVQLDTGSVLVTPVESSKLLGLHIHQTLKWKEHLLSGSTSLLAMLAKRLSVLKRTSRNASFKTRLKVANACFISILTYMISVWGSSESYVLKAIQVIQNKAARHVTKLTWYTPTRQLLKQCNWLSVKQLYIMHTVVQVWKVRKYARPYFINSRLNLTVTRSRLDGNLAIPGFSTTLGRKSFLVQAPTLWNSIPVDIRNTETLGSFKRKLRQWILCNIDIY